METPPQFMPQSGPPKKSNTVLIVVLVILGLCALCCVGLGFGLFGMFNKIKGSIGCVMHYQMARKAVSDYANAHDGKLPPAATWQDDISQYYGKTNGTDKISGGGILDFGDASKDLGCAADNGSPATGMAYNADLAGKTVAKAKENPSTVLLYEVPETGRNISKPYKPQPGQSPNKMVGQLREWITVPVNGSMNISGSQTSSDMKGMNGL